MSLSRMFSDQQVSAIGRFDRELLVEQTYFLYHGKVTVTGPVPDDRDRKVRNSKDILYG